MGTAFTVADTRQRRHAKSGRGERRRAGRQTEKNHADERKEKIAKRAVDIKLGLQSQRDRETRHLLPTHSAPCKHATTAIFTQSGVLFQCLVTGDWCLVSGVWCLVAAGRWLLAVS